MVCLLAGDTVQVTDVHAKSGAVRLELTSIVRPVLESAFAIFGDFKCSLLHYSDGILAVFVQSEARPNFGHIFAISTEKGKTDNGRTVQAFQIAVSSKLFVRHTSRYFYYGTHSGIGDDGHHKWEVSGVSLDAQYPLPKTERPLLFEDFHGTDIGSTIAFEIFDDHFYAVSNQGTFEVEELDWTSFYHCVRFPLNNPTTAALQKDERVYRRQHAQGPIHDSWTDLTLQISEETNGILILESRREWAKASSRQSRTFYTSLFHVNPLRSSSPSFLDDEDEEPSMILPENDIYTNVLDSSNKPNYMLTPPQYTWSRHPEFSPKSETQQRSFILAKTKFRAYNHSAATFLDLVEDEKCCNDPSKPACLRLRIGSRRPIGPTQEGNGKGKGKAPAVHVDANDFADNEQYTYSPIRMWPPPASKCACAKRLHGILNPGMQAGARSVRGVLGEGALVYMVKEGRGYAEEEGWGTVVVVGFERGHEDGGFDEGCWEWKVGMGRECAKGKCR